MKSAAPLLTILLTMLCGCASPYLHTKHVGGPRDTESKSWSLNEDGNWSSTREWNFMGVDGKLIETPNWEIYTTIENQRFIDFLPEFYEAALERYRTAFGPLPPPPNAMATYLFGDRRQWKNKTRMMLPELASSFEGLGRGGFTANGIAVLYDIDNSMWNRDTLSLSSHEGWHQYAQTTFQQQLPPWLDEGIATMMEGFRIRQGTFDFNTASNRERSYRLRTARRGGTLIPLRTLLDGDPHVFLEQGKSDLLTYYAQVWALARYLSEADDGKYLPALQDVLMLAVEGDLFRQLLRSDAAKRREDPSSSATGIVFVEAFFNDDFEEFEAGYETWIEELTSRRSWRR
tara:strand:- start:1961 stop:2995 length:1035 start_codon:yes stop_codon:yes gene_type:complete